MPCVVAVWNISGYQLKHLGCLETYCCVGAKTHFDQEITPWGTIRYYRYFLKPNYTLRLHTGSKKFHYQCDSNMWCSRVYFSWIFKIVFLCLASISLLCALGHHIMSLCLTDPFCGSAVINENNNQLRTHLLHSIKPVIYWHSQDMNIKYNLVFKIV